MIAHPAPFFKASLINLFPSNFFPLIAKNKLPFLIDLVSIERPLKLTSFFFLIFLLKLIDFENCLFFYLFFIFNV